MRIQVLTTSFTFLFVLFGVSAMAQEASPTGPLPDSPIDYAMIQAKGDKLIVQRLRPVHEMVEQTYTVQVPVTVMRGDKQVTEYRPETRTRMVTVVKMITETQEQLLASAQFATVSGKRVTDPALVRKALADSRPAVIAHKPLPLHRFYQQMLQPNLVVVHLRAAGAVAPAPPAANPGRSVEPEPTPPAAERIDDLFGN